MKYTFLPLPHPSQPLLLSQSPSFLNKYFNRCMSRWHIMIWSYMHAICILCCCTQSKTVYIPVRASNDIKKNQLKSKGNSQERRRTWSVIKLCEGFLVTKLLLQITLSVCPCRPSVWNRSSSSSIVDPWSSHLEQPRGGLGIRIGKILHTYCHDHSHLCNILHLSAPSWTKIISWGFDLDQSFPIRRHQPQELCVYLEVGRVRDNTFAL